MVQIKKEEMTHVWACGSISVTAPSGLTRPCRSTSKQVVLLSTTLWCANAARTREILVLLSPIWFVPDHFSSTYPAFPNGRRGVARNVLYIKLQLSISPSTDSGGSTSLVKVPTDAPLALKSKVITWLWVSVWMVKQPCWDTYLAKTCNHSVPHTF
jgi:hypothetical protein